MSEFKVSVIIPVYNGEKYIQACLDRLGAEKYPSLEIIVVDDGSADSTAQILDKISAERANITVIHQPNRGVSAARNSGLDIAQGDAVMFLDCDDYAEENCIGQLVSAMLERDADIVRFRLCYSYPSGSVRDGRAEFADTAVIEKADFLENVYLPMMRGVRYNHIVRTLYRRRVIDGIRFRTDLRTAEDLCFNIQAFSNAERFVYLPDIRYYYYCSGTGLTGSGLPWREKIRCNAKVAMSIKSALPIWGCDTILNRLRADTRIVRIMLSKLWRILTKSDAF